MRFVIGKISSHGFDACIFLRVTKPIPNHVDCSKNVLIVIEVFVVIILL